MPSMINELPKPMASLLVPGSIERASRLLSHLSLQPLYDVVLLLYPSLGSTTTSLKTVCKLNLCFQLIFWPEGSYTSLLSGFLPQDVQKHLKLEMAQIILPPCKPCFYFFPSPVQLVALFSFWPLCIQPRHHPPLCLISCQGLSYLRYVFHN